MDKAKEYFSELGKKGQETLTKLGNRYKFTPQDSRRGGKTSKRPKMVDSLSGEKLDG